MIWESATVTSYGTVSTDRASYHPLQTVQLTATPPSTGASTCTFVLCDPDRKEYLRVDARISDGVATASFLARGEAGAHYVFVFWGETKRYSRYVNFRVVPETSIVSGIAGVDALYGLTKEMMLLGRRSYRTPRGPFAGYISGDTWHFDGIWLRDWIYGFPAFRYWESCLTSSVDRFFEKQSPDGMIPDGIERTGDTWRVGLESDVEYIAVFAVYYAWQATMDDAWLERALPRLEKALAYVRSDPRHWDDEHELVKRQHSCDTWDYDIDGVSDKGDCRHVIATCDQAGYVRAFGMMADMYAALDKGEQAAAWTAYRDAYRDRAVALLWDGVKFRHHHHLDPIGHGDFDESEQLAMGNTWAITRGLADEEQARSIIAEYERRSVRTGDAYPWWSLQPGYPDRLGYFKEDYRKEGGYANGGLMPWVGGALASGAFCSGREEYGYALLTQYIEHLERTGGAQVWYWRDGRPGMRTTNEVGYHGWNMAHWTDALFRGLAGIEDDGSGFGRLCLAPRWAVTPSTDITASAHYAASDRYAAYRQRLHAAEGTVTLTVTGTVTSADVSVLLPLGWSPVEASVDGTKVRCSVIRHGESIYASVGRCAMSSAQIMEISIRCSRPGTDHART